VAAGATAPVRITLAWDDVEGDAATAVTASKLINDLDLVLVDPNGAKHYPWQLDQKIVDKVGDPIPDALQVCGTPISVQRRFVPVANPTYLGPGSPSNVNDAIPAGGVPKAVTGGRDHLNNVEVVDAPAIPGTWIAQVSGFHVPQAPQKFSLIGNSLSPLIVHATSVCANFPALCAKIRIHPDLCERFPAICATRISFPVHGRIRIGFPDLGQKIVLPLDAICRYAISCTVCPGGGLCSNLELQLASSGTVLKAAVYSSKGRLAIRDATANSSKRLRFSPRYGEEYFLVLSPGQRTRAGTDYDVSLQLR
jgi:hypothetical protein